MLFFFCFYTPISIHLTWRRLVVCVPFVKIYFYIWKRYWLRVISLVFGKTYRRLVIRLDRASPTRCPPQLFLFVDHTLSIACNFSISIKTLGSNIWYKTPVGPEVLGFHKAYEKFFQIVFQFHLHCRLNGNDRIICKRRLLIYRTIQY